MISLFNKILFQKFITHPNFYSYQMTKFTRSPTLQLFFTKTFNHTTSTNKNTFKTLLLQPNKTINHPTPQTIQQSYRSHSAPQQQTMFPQPPRPTSTTPSTQYFGHFQHLTPQNFHFWKFQPTTYPHYIPPGFQPIYHQPWQ